MRAASPIACAWLLLGPGLCAAPLQVSIEPSTAPTLHLKATGASSSHVNLEASFDLNDWFLVQSGPVSGGQAIFELTREEPLSAQFFRAVEAPPPFTARVGPQADPLRSAAGLVTPEAGGTLSLTGPDGTTYELTVRPHQVWEPVVVSMTLITNFTDLPLSNSFRAAVQLEPDGLEFRGEAGLRIRFTNAVPEYEMVGYGFAGDGGGFHLRPWRAGTNEVVLPLAHFSGAGVAAEPFPPSGHFMQRFDQAWNSTRDAGRVADQWAAEELREASRWRQKGWFTQEEFERQIEAVRDARNRKEYKLGVEPLLQAAMSDCAVGQVVLHRLDQLESRSGRPYMSGPFAQDLQRLYSPVRCNCAHYFLDLCEKNPDASGIGITRELTSLLQDMETMYGLSDDPACDLGDNAAILERLRQGPCHKPWEGRVVYTRDETERWTAGSGGFETRKNRRASVAFVGRVTELLEQDGDPDPDFNWESWRLRLMGRLTASLDDEGTQVLTDADWRTTETDERQGRFDQQVKGDLSLRFEQGQPETALASVGLEDVTYAMPRKRITEKFVECWGSPPPCCPCPEPVPRNSRDDGSDNLYFAFGSIPRNVKELSWQNGRLKIVFEEVSRVDTPPPGFRDYVKERIERMTVELYRGGTQ